MPFSWNQALLDQLGFAWQAQFLPRLEELTDEEYLWEPVEGCWSVRPGAPGDWRQEFPRPEPVSPPFTTIAWRLAHMADFFHTRASYQFGDGTFQRDRLPWTGRADDAMRIVTEAYERWTSRVKSLGEESLFRPCGPSEHHFAAQPVLHLNREFLQHAAEIALVRDLYRDVVARGMGRLDRTKT